MVFFTCSSCGDSLKKNAVEKHFSSRCSSAQYVTCIDCSKDFWGNDYNDHTSCLTEDEKYGSSGQVVKELKGKKKQQQWIQNLKLYLENYKNLDSNLQHVIQNIITYDNIPQKEKKFKNFLVNSLHLNPKVIDKAWEIFQGALKSSPKICTDSESGKIQLDTDSSNDTAEKITDDTTSEKDNLLDKSLKKKKSKKREMDDEKNDDEQAGLTDQNSSETIVVVQDAQDAVEIDKIFKKKIKNKNKDFQKQNNSLKNSNENEESCDTDNHNNEDIQMTDETLKTKKKKKSSSESGKLANGKNDSDVSKPMDIDQNMEDGTTSKKSKKSNKRSVSEMEDVSEDKQDSTNGANGGSRSTKKKLKLESNVDNDCKKEFKWEVSVKLALENQTKGLKIKKLEKIVIPQLLETKLVLAEDEARRLFKEHISSSIYVINGKMIKLK